MSDPMYTCITCQVAFSSPDLQRTHYKSDWHRYNLKRKVAEFPPISAETFQERVIALKMEESVKLKDKQCYCNDCHKSFANEKSFESHIRSHKHQNVVKKNSQTASPSKPVEEHSKEDSNETEEEDGEEESEPLEVNECLFCPQCSDNLELNLNHMSLSHGFFIPDIEYLTNLKDLMAYLGEKVGVANLCLYCNERGKMFFSTEAVQHHMIDKSHCKLFFEGDSALEFAEFYDYSKSYPEGGSPDDNIVQSVLNVNDDLELVLPSGVALGHRYLKHHYKQHLPTLEQRKASLVGRVMAHYRAIGWKGSYDVGQRQKDVSLSLKMKQQGYMKLGVKANKFQKHFRPQVVF